MTFCTITREPGHGGIARVSSLLWSVIESRYRGACEQLTLMQDCTGVTCKDRLRFTRDVMTRQLFSRCNEMFFDHLGIARLQAIVPRFARRPYGIFLHGIEAWEPLEGSRLKVVRDATLRVANSRYTATRVAAANPEIGSIEVCHLALESRIGREPSNVGVSFLKQIRPDSVLIVGRMSSTERYKGHEQLIQAWPRVQRAIPDAQLIVIGTGDDAPRLQQLTENQGVSRGVLFTGPVTDDVLQAIYDRVALFAMPSRGEGFGIVYLEAMRHGLPCIASTNDAAQEIVLDNETGYLVDQQDIEGIATRVVKLLADPPLRRRLGYNGLQRLEADFSFEAFSSRIGQLLDKLRDHGR